MVKRTDAVRLGEIAPGLFLSRAPLPQSQPASLLARAPRRTARRQRLVPREEGHAQPGNPAC